MEEVLKTLKIFFTETLINNILDKGIKILLVIIIGKILSNIIVSSIKKFYNKPSLTLSERKAKTLSSIFCSVARYGIDFLIIYNVLMSLGIEATSILAFASVFGVAVGLGAQNFVKDIINGFLLLLEDHVGIGDYVEINGKVGIVEDKGLRTTNVRSQDGTLHIIPNSAIQVIGNMKKDFSRSILSFTVGTDLSEDKILAIFTSEVTYRKEELDETMAYITVLGVTKSNPTEKTVKILIDSYFGKQEENEEKLKKYITNTLEREDIKILKG